MKTLKLTTLLALLYISFVIILWTATLLFVLDENSPSVYISENFWEKLSLELKESFERAEKFLGIVVVVTLLLHVAIQYLQDKLEVLFFILLSVENFIYSAVAIFFTNFFLWISGLEGISEFYIIAIGHIIGTFLIVNKYYTKWLR